MPWFQTPKVIKRRGLTSTWASRPGARCGLVTRAQLRHVLMLSRAPSGHHHLS
jgi:hypothetical protein